MSLGFQRSRKRAVNPVRLLLCALLAGGLPWALPATAAPVNKVQGTWRMVSANIEREGQTLPAYGLAPNSLLVFTADMHFIEVMTDSTIPRFASNTRGQGTAEENHAAMAGSIGLFGTYTVDEQGNFSGNRVEGSTFPNWVGDVRTHQQLKLVVDGDQLTETFQRPEGTRIAIEWQRVAVAK